MSGKKLPDSVSRRSVLKTASVASAAATGITGLGFAMPSQSVAGGKTLEDKRVFQSKALRVHLPQKAESVGSLKNADLGMISTSDDVSRSKLVSAIKTQTPLTFIGPNAPEKLVATVYDIPESKVAAKAANNSFEMPTNIDMTLSMAFPQNSNPRIATLWPTVDEISTHMSGTLSEYTDNFILSEMDVHFTDKTGGFTETSSGNYTTSGTNCSDAAESDEWNCKDPNSERYNNCPKGIINRDTRAAKAVENDSDKDYFAVEIRQSILPNTSDQSDCDNQGKDYDWRTKRIDHSSNMGEPANFTWKETRHSPDSTADDYNQTHNLDGTLGVKTAEVSAGYSWSRSESGVQVDEQVDKDDNVVGHDWSLKDDVGKSFFEARSGFRADSTQDDVSYFGYSYDNQYKFKQSNWCCSRTKLYKYSGEHYWTF